MIDTLSSDQIAQIVYLVLLGTVLGSYALVAMRRQLGHFVRMLLLWGLLFTGVMAGWGLWQSVMLPSITVQHTGEDAIDLRRGRDGAFRMTLEVTGREGHAAQPIHFIVDTGATDIVLTGEDATALGFTDDDLAFLGTARTANGLVRTAQVRLEAVQLGDQQHRNVRALVNEGDLHVSLLGMTFLSRFSRIEMMGDRLRLEY